MERSIPQFVHNEEAYTEYAIAQAHIIEDLLPTLRDVLGDVNTNINSVFTVCDYGAADGGNSLLAIKACRDYLDVSQGRDIELCWVFNDLPNNNFEALFKNIQGCWDDSLPEGSNILTLASGKTFYKQVMPRGSVDLGVCFTAVHWLSERPDKDPFDTAGRKSTIAKEIGQRNWSQFLLSRAKELKPGGQMLIAVPSDKVNTERFVIERVKLLALQHLFADGVISEDEFKTASLDVYVIRSEEEILFPFERQPDLPVVKSGLQLVTLEHRQPKDMLVTEWENSGGSKNKSATNNFVRKMVNMVKTTSKTYLSILEKNRDAEENKRLTHKFYSVVEEIIRQDPYAFDSVISHHVVQIKKI